MNDSAHTLALKKLKQQVRFYGLNPKDWVLRPKPSIKGQMALFTLKHREDPSLKLLAGYTWRQAFQLSHIEVCGF